MHNVTHEVKDGKLIITVSVAAENCAAAPPSASGKTQTVATTAGSVPIPSPKGWSIGFSLNVNAKKQ